MQSTCHIRNFYEHFKHSSQTGEKEEDTGNYWGETDSEF